MTRYELDEEALGWASNVMNQGGMFGVLDPDIGENFIVNGKDDVIGHDEIYPSFCNLAEMCGHGEQFQLYCEAAIGSGKLAQISEYFASA
jgi:hypothetical protein